MRLSQKRPRRATVVDFHTGAAHGAGDRALITVASLLGGRFTRVLAGLLVHRPALVVSWPLRAGHRTVGGFSNAGNPAVLGVVGR
jgi:hypothetical protein